MEDVIAEVSRLALPFEAQRAKEGGLH